MRLITDVLSGEATVSGWFVLLLLVLAALSGALITAGLHEDRQPPRGQQRPQERPIRPPRPVRTPVTGVALRPPRRPRRPEYTGRGDRPPRSSPPLLTGTPPRLAWIWEGWTANPLAAGWAPVPRID